MHKCNFYKLIIISIHTLNSYYSPCDRVSTRGNWSLILNYVVTPASYSKSSTTRKIRNNNTIPREIAQIHLTIRIIFPSSPHASSCFFLFGFFPSLSSYFIFNNIPSPTRQTITSFRVRVCVCKRDVYTQSVSQRLYDNFTLKIHGTSSPLRVHRAQYNYLTASLSTITLRY